LLPRLDIEALGPRPLAEFLDRDVVELRHHVVAQLLPHRPHHLVGKRRADRQIVGPGSRVWPPPAPDAPARGEALPLAAQAVAAARAALAVQDAGAHQMLQDLLEI